MTQPEFLLADLQRAEHAAAVLHLLDAYANDPAGGGVALSDYCRANLIERLKQRPNCLILLARWQGQFVGMALCFEGFSTFACQPLLNIHDFTVLPQARGLGLGKQMLHELSRLAQARGYCKLTLEVLQGNRPAYELYLQQGFAPYQLDPEFGAAVILQKYLD